MAYLHRDTEQKDWFPTIETRKDGPELGEGTCDSVAISMYGDSTFRFSRPDGKRDPAGEQKVVNQMRIMTSRGPV